MNRLSKYALSKPCLHLKSVPGAEIEVFECVVGFPASGVHSGGNCTMIMHVRLFDLVVLQSTKHFGCRSG